MESDLGAERYAEYIAGDDSAFTELIREYYEGLTLYLVSITHDMTLAEEAAEDAFVKLVTRKPRFDRRSTFKTWLYTIGRNIARDKIKKLAKTRTLPLESSIGSADNFDLEAAILKKEENAALYRGLMMLKSEYRQALWLTYFEGLSLKEVAAVMHRSESSVDHLIRRGKYALRAELTEEPEGRRDKKNERLQRS